MEQRHYLSLARQHDEADLAQKITHQNHFFVRLTNMVRAVDPTSKILLKHYRDNYSNGSQRSLADLIMNIMYLRNTMSRDIVKSCEQGKMPWLKVEGGRLSESSKRDVDNLFLALGGKIFFSGSVNPMKERSKAPRKGFGELVSGTFRGIMKSTNWDP